MILDEIDNCFISESTILASSKGSQELLAHLICAHDDLSTSSLSFLKDEEVINFGRSHVDKDIGHFSDFRTNIDPDEFLGDTTTENYLRVDLLYIREELV